jgi:uncharacterized protein (DUF488 family)
MSAITIYTVGHSTRSPEELLALLREAEVELIADVRAFPSSRRHPQFNQSALEQWLGAAGIAYLHMRALGGRRRAAPDSPNRGWRENAFQGYADHMASAEFQLALADLEAAARERATAIMCAEAVWWRCHRRIITDYLLAEGVPVAHVMGHGKVALAKPTPGVRSRPDGTLVYSASGNEDTQQRSRPPIGASVAGLV